MSRVRNGEREKIRAIERRKAIDTAEERIDGPEDRSREVTQTETQRGKK